MTIPQSIEKELNSLDEKRKETLSLIDVATMAEEVAERFKDTMQIETTITRWIGEQPFVNIRINLKGFRDTLPVLTVLASKGWHTDKECPYVDYAELNRRTFNMIRDSSTGKVTIDPANGKVCESASSKKYSLRVMCFLVNEGATCRKVQVGTKQEPVYEFVCDQA